MLLIIGILVMVSIFLKEASFIIGIYIALGIVSVIFIITTLGVWQKTTDRLVLIELQHDNLHVQMQHYSSLKDVHIPVKQLSISVDVAYENKKGDWISFEVEINDKNSKDRPVVSELDIYEAGPLLEAIEGNKLKKLNKIETEILEYYKRIGSKPLDIKKWGIILALAAAAVYVYLNKEMAQQFIKDIQVKPGLEIGAWRSEADGFSYYFQLRVDSTWEENYYDKTGTWKWIPGDTITNSSPSLLLFTSSSSFNFTVQDLTENSLVLRNSANEMVFRFSRLKGGSFSKPNVTQRFIHFMNQSVLIPPDQEVFLSWLRELSVSDESLRPQQVLIQSDTLFVGLLANQQKDKFFILGIDDFSQKQAFLTQLSYTPGCTNSFSITTNGMSALLKQEETCSAGTPPMNNRMYRITKIGIQKMAD
ncbi:MAG: hypothetical protein KF803_01925 [Cyclobacteriaceae bacterium]|nr:hypothetical protein [Cyclobacteriaceae bacterium]